ncbi:beta strand repeat-containing protein [Mesorhizobium sp. 131-2-1]|uniref:beta strand repeat-containing protein n=1 Tax=Mesorhizobium sp. 131-2-1 TaxID=2744518 RepID=UPI0019269925|nr:VCBS domain-containing protein [Mesorhizobium sp. 131-2-1]BCG93589.1 hypothetical protein MesoLj131a_24530 [Mesorhizobium sp. 131-2-1]
MATQVTGAGGTTTSFSNTPQAKDDTFLYSEDAASILILNVLANDLGGAAKTLYSIDDSVSASTATKTYAPAELLTKDITYTTDSAGATGTTDTSYLGAKIWIASDGTIHYSTANIDAKLQALATGEILVDKVTYAIQLGNGTLSWATATIQFTGTNDKPDIHLVTTDSAAASLNETNAPLTASGTLTVNDADVSDTVSATVDSVSLGGTTGGLNSAAVINMLTVSPASLTADASENHNLSWSFNSTPQAFDFLAAGETLTLTYTIKADDNHGGTDTQTVTVTITGTNDAPDIHLVTTDSAAAGLNETNSPLSANGTLTVNDADLSDTVTPSVTLVSPVGPTGGLSNATLLGMLTVAPGPLAANPTDSHNLSWSFNSTPQAFDFLAAGETLTLTYTVKADDGHTGTDTQTVAITITGTNDAPDISVGAADSAAAGLNETNLPLSTSGTLTVNDADLSDTVTPTVDSVALSGVTGSLAQADVIGMLTVSPPSIAANPGDAGNLGWSFNSTPQAFDFLAAGETLTLTYTVKADDGHTGTDTQTVAITITGTNDAPDISVGAADSAAAGLNETNLPLSTSGTLTVNDADLSDTVTPTVDSVALSGVTGSLAQADVIGMLTVSPPSIAANPGDAGNLGWSFNSTPQAFDFLAAGETLTLTYTVKADDGHTGTDTQTVAITITGTNDAPDISVGAADSAAAGLNETNLPLSTSGTLTVNDADLSDTVTPTVDSVALSGVTGSLAQADVIGMLTVSPPSIAANPGDAGNLGWSFNSTPQAFDFLAAGETLTLTYTVKADDGHTGTDTQTVAITITGTNDAPDISVGAADSAAAGLNETNLPLSTSGTLTVNDADLSDTVTPTVDSVALSGVTGSLAQADVIGMLTVSPPSIAANPGDAGNLGWSFNSTPQAFDFLAAGETLTLTYTVKADDGHTGTDTQTVAITITGTNDAPDISVGAADSAAAGLNETNLPLSTSGTLTVNDADLSDTVTPTVDSVALSGVTGSLAQADVIGMLTVSPPSIAANPGDAGNLGWSFNSTPQAFDFLAAGETLTLTYTVKADDGHTGTDTQTVAITITGTNDAPDISVGAADSAAAGLNETNLPLSTSGTLTVNDADLSDTVTPTVDSVALSGVTGSLAQADVIGMLTVSPPSIAANPGDAGNLGWSFNSTPQAFDFLAAGETLTLTYTVKADDGHTGTDTQTVAITITGTNDAPDISVGAADSAAAGLNETNLPLSTSGTLTVNDADLSDTVTPTVDSVALSGVTGSLAQADVIGMLTVSPPSIAANPGDAGNLGWSFNSTPQAFDFLAAGETLTLTYTVKADDGHTGTDTQTVAITITGTNDAPVLDLDANNSSLKTGADYQATFTENGSAVAIADTDVSISDLDNTNATSATITLTNAQASDLLAVNGGLPAGITASSYNSGTGVLTLTGSATLAAYQTALHQIVFSNSGDNPSTTDRSITVVVNDGSANSNTATSTIHVTAVNDAPVLDLDSASAGTSTSINYTVGSAAAAIAPSATVTDVDSPDFNGGSLTVAFTSNGTSADQLTIQNQGVAAGQIGVSGSNVTYGGTIIGTFSGGTNGTNLVVTLNANATQAATQALADHILYSNATSATTTKTVTYTLVDGDGGTDTATATATISVTGGGQAPVVDLNGPGAGNDATASYPSQTTPSSIAGSATISDADSTTLTSLTATLTNRPDDAVGNPKEFLSLTLSASSAATAAGLTVNYDTSTGVLSVSGAATVATYQTILQGLQYADTKTGSHDQTPRVVNVTVSDGTNASVSHSITISVAKPAGIAGEPINLALADPTGSHLPVSVTVAAIPAGWTVDGATHNSDGTWTIQTNDVHSLTVTTPADFAGAMVLDISMTWTNADGTTGSASVADNVEAYAPGSPIFAWSGDDVLTGSSGNDLFVFSQPIGNDTVHSFDAAADQIDLIGYSGFQSFADVQAHMADDANGNAVIALGDGQSIMLDGVHSSALTDGNFVFDQTPVVNNAGTMTISDGALLPLSGTINNSGLISLDSTGGDTLLQLIQHGITLQGGGQIVLSDSVGNVISGTATDVTLTNVDNTISGAGQLGGGSLSLNNQGTIAATGTQALVIDTGDNVTVNSGTLEATGSGGLMITGALANSGLIWANGGNVTIDGQVTGSGSATIGNLSQLEFGEASSINVTFATDAAGILRLDDSFDFSGKIGGMTSDDKIDLGDISFGAGTSAAYQVDQDGSGGTLTVTDGTHNATLHLLGVYDANSFALADDGAGRTVVHLSDFVV